MITQSFKSILFLNLAQAKYEFPSNIVCIRKTSASAGELVNQIKSLLYSPEKHLSGLQSDNVKWQVSSRYCLDSVRWRLHNMSVDIDHL